MELRDEFILKAQDYFDKYDAGKVIIFDEEYNRYKKKVQELWDRLFSKDMSQAAKDNLMKTLRSDILTFIHGELEFMDVLRELNGYIEGHNGCDELRVLTCILLIFQTIEKVK